jgi:flagellar motility protein MotE (MotC chaperone)
MRGLRLIDAVVIAAVAMLGLKTLGLLSGSRSSAPSQVAAAARAAPPGEQLPEFARVLAHARSNYVPPDVAMTGAVADDKKSEPAASTANDKKSEPAPGATDKPAANAASEAGSAGSASERALLERLGERRDELQQRSREIDMRERLLENAERKLEGRINELKTLEDKAEAVATKRGETEMGAIRNLVTMYETMKPKDAARVFDRLSHDVLVPVVLQMKPAKMAEVLAVMSPDAAEKLTVALAKRAKGLSAESRAAATPTGLPDNELPAIDAPTPQSKR